MPSITMSKINRKLALCLAACAASLTVAVTMVTTPARAEFGIAAFDQQIMADSSGHPFTQAGGHPYQISTEVDFNSHEDPAFFGQPVPDADTKDVIAELPPGLFGNTTGIGQCTESQLSGANTLAFENVHEPECPITSQVGLIQLRTDLYNLVPISWTFPLYNMVPPSDMPASFGFAVAGVPITLQGNVRNGGDFGVNVISPNIPISIPVDGFTITFWGDPADPSHDSVRCDRGFFGLANPENPREPYCWREGSEPPSRGPNADPEAPKAFLTIPVSCNAPGQGMKSTLRIDSWATPGAFAEREMVNHLPPGYPLAPAEWGPQQGMTGCDFVPFNPSVSVEPTNHQADTPTGLNIDFKLPQEGLLNPEGIATSDVKKTVVTLPAGISVSPSAASGLGACSTAEIGLNSGFEPTCPDSSKLGSIEIDTPLLDVPLTGSIYLAKQGENPFGSLMAIYMVAKAHGVLIKLAGRIDLDPVTGQLVTTVEDSPQLPFDELKVDFKGGPRSPLVNPHTCGTYAANAQLTPWSGNAPANIAGSFEITSGPNGAPCPVPAQFAPGFTVGTVNNQAGAFSPLTLTMSRADGDQQLGGVTMKTPTGLLGTLASVSLCPEPQASRGLCGQTSQIGELTVAAGAGPNPFYVTGGKVYITGPYHGAPFGLSVVVPAKAGPFDLGTVVVRGTISVDPHTAALTISTDPLPTILQGIPLDLRVINVSIDRPAFIFNPTDCNPMSITGTLTGGAGLSEPVGSSFQVTNCASLGFKPSFRVLTSGKTSRANGASLDAQLTYPKGSFGHQANIARVKVALPRQLPSRLETLQKACPAETFDANPAACPEASKIGSATASTQVLPVQLSGPVYFVSHGGEAFPDLVVVLQGYGVTVQLVGTTFISKAGITSTTFSTVPDVPIESFELKLPQGRYSALAASGNLCAANLSMPTLFVGQDGAVIKRSTPIAVTGCGKHKPYRRHHKREHKHRAR